MNIYYEVHGNGYPIILLHGNQENRKIYDQLVKDLENDYQLIAMDSRYHGKSIKSGPLTLDRMAQDVMDVANELNLEAYDVIGFSDGANIALTLAGKDERLKHMVLLSPNATPKGIKWYYRLHMYMTLLLLPIFCIYDKRSRIRFKLISFMTKEPHFTADYLTELKIPALLLSGENDVIKDSDFTFIQSSLPYCVHKVIKNSPHFLLGDQYDKTLREIRGFYMPVITKHNVLDIKNVGFGEGTPKICLPIVDTTKEGIIDTLDSYKDLDYDVVEIRLDFYEGLKEGHLTDVLEEIKKHTDKLVLGTIRTVSEGGEGELNSLEYMHCIKEICDAHVDLVDIELSQGYESVMELVQYAHKKGVHVIMSEHHFDETPSREDMQETLEKMEILGADLPKLAVMPKSKEDLLTLLEATLYSSQRLGKPIITMSMGKLGRLSRMMGNIFGSCMTFATAKDASAPGQVPLDDLKKVLEVLHD